MNSHKDNTPPGGKEEYMEPLLKYRGGKRREIPNFRNLIPQNYTTYIEPFFGGGAVFFDQEPVQSIINDINHPLINFYQQVANNYPQLMQELTELHVLYEQNETEYARQKTLHPEARVPNNNEPLYYQLRDMYNGLTPSTYLDGTAAKVNTRSMLVKMSEHTWPILLADRQMITLSCVFQTICISMLL